jgi:hypothetical protein
MFNLPVYSPFFGLSYVGRQSPGRDSGLSWLAHESSFIQILLRIITGNV